MIWLKLTGFNDNEKIRLNAGLLVGYQYVPLDKRTVIYFENDEGCFFVKESPEEIDRLISEAMAAQD